MAKFEAKEFNLSDINGGNKYVNGDAVTPDAINAPIEAAALVQSLAKNQPEVVNNEGEAVLYPTVEIRYKDNGEPYFVFTNLGLPVVSSSDNGKMLYVQNGKWVAKTLPVYNGSVTIEG